MVYLRISSASDACISLNNTLMRILSGNWIPCQSRCLRSMFSRLSMAALIPPMVFARSFSGFVVFEAQASPLLQDIELVSLGSFNNRLGVSLRLELDVSPELRDV